jgi:hypothetical protein
VLLEKLQEFLSIAASPRVLVVIINKTFEESTVD